MAKPTHPISSYTVGWICALSLELQASRAVLDEEHEDPPRESHETNVYCLGRIGEHNVAMSCLPEGHYGTNYAATLATEMLAKFPSMRYALMVGIGGGVPSEAADIRLGDVIVSKPTGNYGGVVQHDLGKTEVGGKVVQTGYLNQPPKILLNALSKFRSAESDHSKAMMSHIVLAGERPDDDKLYESTYDHAGGDTCGGCDSKKIIPRPIRKQDIGIHYGLIASGNQVIKDGATRDRISKRLGGVLCFEMEAAGIMDSIQCLVIRGVCDYSDSHKNKVWQPYAAATAAAFSKELLSITPPERPKDPIDKGRSAQSNDEHDELLRSLAFPEMKYRRDDADKAYKDTCQWILQHEKYKRWMHQDDGLLWIKGKPGSGKSTLMAYLFGQLNTTTMQAEAICLDFFFHGRGVNLQRSQVGMLRALLFQLFQSDPSIRGLFHEVFSDKKKYRNNWEWQTRELQRLLTTTILATAQTRKVIIFVDALDEAGDEAHSVVEYLHGLNDHIQSRKASAKICIACRHYPVTATIPGDEIHVEQHNRKDIAAYITAKLPLDKNSCQDQFDELKKTLVEKASGVFQWVILVVHIVTLAQQKGKSPKEIHAMVDKLQPELKQIYEHIIKSIEQEERECALLLMQWVCLAEEPLSVMQLRFAMAADEIDIDCPRSYETASKNFVESDARMKQIIVTLSGGLLEIKYTKDTDDTDGTDGKDHVQPIHQSVKEFMMKSGLALLKSEEHANTIGESPTNEIAQGHNRLCRSCIRYLKWVHLNHLWSMKWATRNLVALAPLIAYSTKYWPIHASHSERHGVPQAMVAIEWTHDDIFNVWVSLYIRHDPWKKGCAQNGSKLLHVASSLNLHSVVQAALQQGEDIESQDHSGNRPLHMAALRGNLELASTLLDRGAELQPMNIDMSTPFDIAVANGHVEVMRMLVVRGRDANDDILGKQSLYSAAYNGHLSMVHALLSLGPNVNGDGDRLDAPLQAAVEEGHFQIADLLLKKGANVNFLDCAGDCYLHRAPSVGRERIFYMLLERGANVNTLGRDGRCVLMKAVSRNSTKIVHALLESGADVNQKSLDGKTPLHYAVSYAVAKLLLERGANHMARSADGRTPLMDIVSTPSFYRQKPARIEQSNLLQLFLKTAKEDLGLKDQSGDTLLLCVFSGGFEGNLRRYEDAFEATVQLLLDNGSDIQERNNYGRTALHLAAYSGLRKATSVLLRNGADPRILDSSGRTPLHYAAQSNSASVVELLLQHGSNLSEPDQQGFTPLAYATRQGNTEAVRLLLAQGPLSHLSEESTKSLMFNAIHESPDLIELYLDHYHFDLECKGRDGNTLLLEALSRDSIDSRAVVLFLLDRGANIAARNKFGQTVLHVFLCRPTGLIGTGRRALTMVQLLLDRGADPGAQDEEKCTPLHLAVRCGYASIVTLLLEKQADVQAIAKDGRQPLNYLSGKIDDVEILGLLLKHGAHIDTSDDYGWTPLHRVVRRAVSTPIVTALLDAGVYVNARDISGQTALFKADAQAGQALLQSGADLHARDDQGNTCLHSAATRNSAQAMELFVMRGLDVNASNSLGQTPLHVSLMAGRYKSSEKLLKRGANPLLVDYSGRTALHFAAKGSRQVLMDHPPRRPGAMVPFLSVGGSGFPVMRSILESGIKVDQTDQKMRTALHYSCIHRNQDGCQFLLDDGATVEATDGDDRNSLHLLLINWSDSQWGEEGYPDGLFRVSRHEVEAIMTPLLLKRGVDVTSKDRFGRTPLHYAVEQGFDQTTTMLLTKGVSINEYDNLGFTPLHLTSRKGHLKIVNLLLEAGADVFAKCGDQDALYMAALNGHHKVVDVLRLKMQPPGSDGSDKETSLGRREGCTDGQKREGQEDDTTKGRWPSSRIYWFLLPLLCIIVSITLFRFWIEVPTA